MVDVQPRSIRPDRPVQLALDAGPDSGTLHPAVAEWFGREFPLGPTEAQERGWPLIAAGCDTLIAAPTGSGKTLAAFLMAIDSLYQAHRLGEDVSRGVRVLYVSPLKALAVDVAENLERPLAAIGAVAESMGYRRAPIGVAVRTGDTPASERTAMTRRPPTIVVTTPESLYLLLTSPAGRAALRSTRTVIVDEIHALARDKRGAHLAVSLERLEAVCDHRPVRVGLSATQKPLSAVGRLLVGDRPPPAIVDTGHRRLSDLALQLPGGELEAVASAAQMADTVASIAALVATHRTTLVFVNTRSLAERLAHQLAEKLEAEGVPGDSVAAHHGSLSKQRRLRVESALRAGALRALVATASLELGIDVGPVDLVCQIGSPRSIATFLQRVGRSNHSRSGVPKGRLFPMTRDELVECTALLGAVAAGELDAVMPPRLPLDIAAQHLVAETSAGERTFDELKAMLRRADHFRDLTDEQFEELLTLVSEGVQTGRGRKGAYLHLDRVHGLARARKGARLAAVTSGGAIPETGDYRVLAEPDDLFVGTVNEDWAVESSPGDIFLLGSHSWQIRRIEAGVVRVRDAGDTPPTVPFWRGEAPARTDELSKAVSDLRVGVDSRLSDRAVAAAWVSEISGVDRVAARTVVDYLAAGKTVLGVMPSQSDLVLERFFDDSGGMQLVLHSPHGARINRALGMALRKKFCRRFNFELQAAAGDDALVLSLGPHHSFPLDEVPRYLSSSTLRDTLEHAILDAPMFQSRWRWNLNRALLVLRWRGGRRNPPPLQRMESDDLLAAVFPQAAACQDNIVGPREIPGHILVRQTIEDTLHEAMDLDGVTAVVEGWESGRIRVHCRDTTEPSVLAHEIISARPFAFLDDEEFQNRRARAVTLRRGLTPDLGSIGALLPEAIESVHSEILPVPSSPDELHDLLMSAVVLTPRADWSALHAALSTAGRATVVRGMWTASEAVEAATGALDGADEAVVRAIRGHLEIAGITDGSALASATQIDPARVEWALQVLQQEGFAFVGSWTAPGPQWVARRLLARMHSRSRQGRRRSVEAATQQDFVRFLLAWQHLTPSTRLSGRPGLLAILDQLQGWEAAAGAWEPELLSRRLDRYDPAWLDSLCHSGEVAWLRLCPSDTGNGPSRATPMSIAYRSDVPWLLAACRSEAAPSSGADPVLAVLAERGACFASDLVAATRLSPAEVERLLWEAVARGDVMCDGFEAIRARVSGAASDGRPHRLGAPHPYRSPSRYRSGSLRANQPTAASAGRWSLVPAADAGGDAETLAEAVAGQLLARWGVLCRDLAARERTGLRWRDLQWALRRLEDRGLVRGGRFVGGLTGEQYALPEAAEQLAAVRSEMRRGEQVTVNGTDPLNVTGVLLPGDPVPCLRTRHVTFTDGSTETLPVL